MNIGKVECRIEVMGLVGGWLQEKRVERGLSCQDIASATGISLFNVEHLEMGQIPVSYVFLLVVLDTLGCTRDEFFELLEIVAELRHGGVS